MSLLKKLFTSFKKIFKKKKKIKKKKRRNSLKRGKSRREKKLRVKPKPSAKISPAKSIIKEEPANRIGEVTHYFNRIQVVVIKLTKGNLRVGDKIQIRGKGKDFIQAVKSLQIESVDVKTARKGQLVGLKVDKEAKAGDKVYKVH